MAPAGLERLERRVREEEPQVHLPHREAPPERRPARSLELALAVLLPMVGRIPDHGVEPLDACAPGEAGVGERVSHAEPARLGSRGERDRASREGHGVRVGVDPEERVARDEARRLLGRDARARERRREEIERPEEERSCAARGIEDAEARDLVRALSRDEGAQDARDEEPDEEGRRVIASLAPPLVARSQGLLVGRDQGQGALEVRGHERIVASGTDVPGLLAAPNARPYDLRPQGDHHAR